MTSPLIGQLAGQGLLGLLLALTIVGYYLKDRELRREQAARIQDAKDGLEVLVKLQVGSQATLDKTEESLAELRRIAEDLRRVYPGGGLRR